MTVEGHDVAADLRGLLAAGAISEDALSAITGIQPETLRSFLEAPSRSGMVTDPPLTADESRAVSILSGLLVFLGEPADDDRLRSILEALTAVSRLSLDNISRLTGLAVDDLATALQDPATLPFETRYRMGVRCSFLLNSVNVSRVHP